MRPAWYIVFFFCTFAGQYTSAQEKCATVIYNQELNDQAPAKPGTGVFESWLRNQIDRKKAVSRILESQQETIYIIPVVVHVIHSGEPAGVGSNISDEQINSQIVVLNEDFRRQNFDTLNTPDFFKPVAADTYIEFRLANRNPAGEPTDGIVRVEGTQNSWNAESPADDQELKSLSFWPPEDYLNIWVTDLNGSYLGYAQYPETDLPGSLPPYTRETDGVVIDYTVFGSVSSGNFPNLRNQFNLGRTTTHEIGHFLGLRHIWGDDGTSCTGTDYCDDTPNQAGSHDSCSGINPFSCGSEDMYQNYLDYTYDACMNIFTSDQKLRMRTVLENSPRRISLLTSPGLLPPDDLPDNVAVRSIEEPANITCSEIFIPRLLVQNIGTNTVNNFELSITLDEQTFDPIKLVKTLAPGETEEIAAFENMDQIILTRGQHFIKAGIRNTNGVNSPNDVRQDISKYFLSSATQDIVPLREKFEKSGLSGSDWAVYNPDNEITWEYQSLPLGSLENHAVGIDLFDYQGTGQSDWLVSPVLDLTWAADANMKFDYSYAQYDSIEDRLDVKVSVDCGSTFPYTVFSKSSTQLSLRKYSNFWIPLVPGDWSREFVDLSGFQGLSQIRVALIASNGHGNSLYLDNIEFYETGFSKNLDIDENSLIIHPNPTRDGLFYLTVNTTERQPVVFTITDMLGRIIQEHSFNNVLNQTFEFEIISGRNGIYLIHASGPTFNRVSRIFLDK